MKTMIVCCWENSWGLSRITHEVNKNLNNSEALTKLISALFGIRVLIVVASRLDDLASFGYTLRLMKIHVIEDAPYNCQNDNKNRCFQRLLVEKREEFDHRLGKLFHRFVHPIWLCIPRIRIDLFIGRSDIILKCQWDWWPTSNRKTTTGCPIFATVLSSLRWAIFAAAKILLSQPPTISTERQLPPRQKPCQAPKPPNRIIPKRIKLA